MFAKISIILTLMVSLFFAAQVHPYAAPLEAKANCLAPHCAMGCCATKECCAMKAARQTPAPPMHSTPRADFQLATLALRLFSLLSPLPAAERSFAIRDGAPAGHALPLLAVTCIRLI